MKRTFLRTNFADVTVLPQLDWKDQRSGNNQPHHLYDIQKAMNLSDEKDFGDVLDAIFRSLLEDMVFIHSCNIVHRDRESIWIWK